MRRMIGPVFLALAVSGLLAAGRMTWVIAHTVHDEAGSDIVDMYLDGSFWSLESGAIAWFILAGLIASFVFRGWARTLVGVVVALAGAGAAWRPLLLLTYGADPLRANALLHSAASSSNSADTVHIAAWARVASADVAVSGPLIALVAAACAVFGGIFVAFGPGVRKASSAAAGSNPTRSSKYEVTQVRRESLEEDLENSPDSGRIMWDALDADIDPTDRP